MRWLKIAGWAALVCAILFGAGYWTMNMGHTEIAKLAKDQGFCTTESCAEGSDMVYSLMETQGYSPALLDWCLGVDGWANTRVTRGGWVKSLLVEFMYWPCPQFSEESP